MRLILIRHAATLGNGQRFIGREDLPLSAEGEQQVERLAAGLAREHLDAVYSSPLQRAVGTALGIARGRGLDVQLRDDLMEIDFGTLQGTTKGAQSFNLRRAHLRSPMPGGESVADVWERLRPMHDALIGDLSAAREVAVVGHYWSNRILLARLAGHAFEDCFSVPVYKPANASAYALDFQMIGATVSLLTSKWLPL